ncbi:hypothetical protein [Rhizobium hainanense]|uniref:Uncharacterized protein n=1 Tax=Rhizobium hainanense TaxID=52131 RepID=A0A1C3UM99_9HYPH|nr:hypothetical protein [Rhizobium hainanense]SCB16581.1 hypothetical protein GA0061100_102638 [Rhizobium hainanense]
MGKRPYNTHQKKKNATSQKGKEGWWTKFRRGWRGFWDYAGIIVTIFTLWQIFAPSVSITSGANLDGSQIFATQFLVSNTGNFPVYDVWFSCVLVGSSVGVNALSSSNDLLAIKNFPKKAIASRGCFSRSDVDGAMLKVEAHYSWPLIGYEDIEIAYFSAKKSTTGYILTPEPKPENTFEALRIDSQHVAR